jgi:hypothetical protein
MLHKLFGVACREVHLTKEAVSRVGIDSMFFLRGFFIIEIRNIGMTGHPFVWFLWFFVSEILLGYIKR